jgi:HEAT repeats
MVLQDIADTKQKMPGAELRNNFNAMLEAELNLSAKEKALQQREVRKVMILQWASSFWKIAAAAVILFVGVWLGGRGKQVTQGASDTQLAALQKDVKQMQETMMFSLLKDESPSQRIKAVSYAEDIVNPNANVINALTNTLNHDKNVNVRLAALYSLEKFADDQKVIDTLVASLGNQTEPIIQVVLINILTEKKEIKAIRPIQDIISNGKTNKDVRDIAQKSLKSI